ncbi:MAG TPA: type I 3-dehydroquinate dehydratase [Tepidisphaeraceae bacterium]|nr:type I 3-dehydroquinate dehydratase [Tepidisphaeraceae bacterium]
MTDLCVAIFVEDAAQVKRDVAKAAEAGANLVELRLDRITDQPMAINIVDILPCILTCRPTWEGGESRFSDEERLAILGHFALRKARYIDLELETYRRSPKLYSWRGRIGTILSTHDFKGRPDRLYNIVKEMNEATEATVNKIVWSARSIRDNLEAFELIKSRGKPTIALCMGEAGLISRILAKKFGGHLTYAALETGGGTAPGQISISDMKKLYRWDAISSSTKVFGVVGSPIMHSMSPAIHNAGFDAVGFDGIYLPMLVEPGWESFKAFMETFVPFEGLDLSGLSVTIPHKENALRYLKEKGAQVEELAEAIGAVNTIVIDRSGKEPTLRGFNTDYAAILDSITAKMGIERDELENYRVAVIGAGGTGRTAVAALAHYGATVVVYNRTRERADALAKEFDGKSGKVVSARLEKLCDSCCHIFINTTSVGMWPKANESPIGDRPPKFESETVVFDSIYNPIKTKFLEQAEAAGAKTIGGVEMFVRQASGQFEAWTSKKAPTEVMRKVIEARLAH